jgi:hypothetical protein
VVTRSSVMPVADLAERKNAWAAAMYRCSLSMCRPDRRCGRLHGRALSGLAGWSGPGQNSRMKKPLSPHYRHRFPAELISHAVFRDVELLLAERGVVISLRERPTMVPEI